MSAKQEKAFRREVERQIQHHRDQREAKGFANVLNLDAARFHPVGDQVLLEIEVEKVSEGGIIVPDSAQEPRGLPLGRVSAVGEDVKRFKVGELVLCNHLEAQKIDRLLWLVPETKIRCRVDPKPERLIEPVPA